MRIPEFQKLAIIDTQPCLLKNCSVVIDAQNYFYQVYERNKINHVFGCDSNDFASAIRKLIFGFKKADVTCYFVFKGGDSDVQKKISKFRPSYDELNDSYDFVLPVLAKDTIKQVLDELRIDHSTCIFESKEDCVALAEHLGCAVISNDVDFCFKKAPYISYFTMRFNRNQNCFECPQYRLEDFLERNSLTEEKGAIFAVMSDVNCYPKDYFKSLFERWHIFNGRALQQHQLFINWLASHELSVILTDISQYLSVQDHAIFLDKYEKRLEKMRNTSDGIVPNYLIRKRQLTVERHDPDWFEKGVASSIIPIPYINMYKWKILRGSDAIEAKGERDSMMLSIDIILYAYNLLTDFKEDNIKLYQNANSYTNISTKDTKIRKPRYNSRECVFGNGWEHVKGYKLFEHFLSENCINPKNLNNDDLESMLLIALVYFARKKQEARETVNEEVYCVIISYVMLNVVFDKPGSFKKRRYNIYEPECEKAKQATEHYFKADRDEIDLIFNGDILKTLAEFQYCFLHLNYLNVLCGSPYKPSRYHRAYNGTFVYKLLIDMKGNDTDVFITKLFKRSSSVLSYIKSLMKLYHELL